MNIAIDVILAAIFLACVIASAKKGIIRTVLEIVAFLAAIVLAFQLAAPFARTCYDMFLSARVEERIYEQLPGDGSGITYSNQAQAVLEALPDFAKTYLEKSGEGDSFLQQVISGNYSGKDAAKQLNEQIAAPVCETILTSVFFLLLSLVFSAVLSWLAKLISKGFKVPVLSTVNKILGGLFGALKGAVVVYLAVVILLVLAPRIGGEFRTGIETSSIVSFAESYIPESFAINL